MRTMRALQITRPNGPFELCELPVPEPRRDELRVRVEACGMCHSDVFAKSGQYPGLVLPRVLGHEVAGRVEALGEDVRGFRVGDRVGIGWNAGHCGACRACRAGDFPNCVEGQVCGLSYDGGYAEFLVCPANGVARIPDELDAAHAAPLLCAGITTYSPLRHHGIGKGKRVGIVGLGGLGHMGVKLARALGAEVYVLTTSERKRADALRLGAHEVLLSRDAASLAQHAGRFDFLLDTVSADHDVNSLLPLLRRDGNLTLVGAPPNPLAVSSFGLIFGRRNISGSNIGGIAETQELLDFCGAHGITADVEVIAIQQVNEAYERLLRGDVKYRFCIDMASLQKG
jgi:uncharacterized zinc-type alcohol dehydrogenase-like protein